MNFYKAFLALTLIPALVTGCSSHGRNTSAEITNYLVGEGYRYKGDVCQIVGESSLTADLLDDSYDLVACPADITLVGNIAGAKELRNVQGYRIFSVPHQ